MQFFTKPTVYSSAALETVSLVTGSTALSNGGRLLGFIADSTSSSAAWVQVFDGTAAPSNGAVPIISIRVGATSQTSLDCTPFSSLPVTNGIVIALSSTGPTYTAVNTSLFTTVFWVV